MIINYFTHKLEILKSRYDYDGKIFKCITCNIELYSEYFYLIRNMKCVNNSTYELQNVDMGNVCKLNCNEFFIKKLLE